MTNKKICYLLFNNLPSSIVRARTFNDEYLKYEYTPIFYKFYSKRLYRIYSLIISYKFLSKLFINLQSLFILIKINIFLKKCNSYDALIIIKYIKPKLLEKIKLKYKGKILYDFDDAVWLENIMGLDVFKKIINNVDYVSCDNNFLLEKAKKYNINSFILNGPAQVEKFISKNENNKSSIILCWIGSPDTLFYLYVIYDALEFIGDKYPNVILKLLGTGHDKKRIPNFEKIKTIYLSEYDENIMIKELSNSDIGLFPMFNNDLSKGRGLLKTTIYMSAGLPSITSGILDFSNVIIESQNGFIANTTSEWIQKLELLIINDSLRSNIGKNAKEFIYNNYSKSFCFNQLKDNFLIRI